LIIEGSRWSQGRRRPAGADIRRRAVGARSGAAQWSSS